MAVPTHIRIAREQGSRAGFDAYMTYLERSGLPLVKKQLKEIKAQGNRNKQYGYYCSLFGNKLKGAKGSNSAPVAEPVASNPRMEAIAAMQAQLAELLAAESAEVEQAATSTKHPPVRMVSESNTGGDDTARFRPRDPDKPANGNQLWKLNTLGGFGEVLTAGEVYDRIAELLN